MRIVAGKFRHRQLVDSSKFKNLRPTTDSNREALFNILLNGNIVKEINFSLLNCDVLDLCCGTGAIGIEALSRGAQTATFIDNNQQHLLLAKKNAEQLMILNNCQFIQSDALKLPICQKKYQLIFIDPPYDFDYWLIIEELENKGYFTGGNLIVIEHKNFQEKNFNDKNLKEKKTQGQKNEGQNFKNEKNKNFTDQNYKKFNLNFLGQKKYGKTIFDFFWR